MAINLFSQMRNRTDVKNVLVRDCEIIITSEIERLRVITREREGERERERESVLVCVREKERVRVSRNIEEVSE